MNGTSKDSNLGADASDYGNISNFIEYEEHFSHRKGGRKGPGNASFPSLDFCRSQSMAPPRLAAPLVLPRLVHLRFYLIVVVTISITAVCWWRWPPDGGFESASLAIASLCTTLCIPSTLLLINAHIQAWERPLLQLCVVRILLMVPIYAVDAWLGLMQRGSDSARDLIDTVRECHSAGPLASRSPPRSYQ